MEHLSCKNRFILDAASPNCAFFVAKIDFLPLSPVDSSHLLLIHPVENFPNSDKSLCELLLGTSKMIDKR